jgi:2-polyprenyl-3-methyl-5-hydroxy-6-metoxy-1,4-benzoquinol methylase
LSDIAPDPLIDNVFAIRGPLPSRPPSRSICSPRSAPARTASKRSPQKVHASARGVHILCDYLTVQELLIKDGKHYRLTPSSSVFLDKRSPACTTSVIDFLAAPELMQLFLENPAPSVRKGGSVGLANLLPDHPLRVKFARAMVPFMAPVAQGIATEVARWPSPPRKVLDVAAGLGVFGIAIGKAVPGARIVALDCRPVLEIALENARLAGLETRYDTMAGSAFDVEWGSNCDLVLIPNFLHHFDREGCVSILGRARRALAPGGAALVVEMVPNDDQVSPPFPAAFAFVMLATTPKGDAWTARELQEMGRSAGFGDSVVQPLPPSPQTMIVFC